MNSFSPDTLPEKLGTCIFFAQFPLDHWELFESFRQYSTVERDLSRYQNWKELVISAVFQNFGRKFEWIGINFGAFLELWQNFFQQTKRKMNAEDIFCLFLEFRPKIKAAYLKIRPFLRKTAEILLTSLIILLIDHMRVWRKTVMLHIHYNNIFLIF